MKQLELFLDKQAGEEEDAQLKARFLEHAFPTHYYSQLYEHGDDGGNICGGIAKDYGTDAAAVRDAAVRENARKERLLALWKSFDKGEKIAWKQKLNEQMPLWNITFTPHRSVRATARAWTKEAALAAAAKTLQIDMADRDHYRIRESFTGFRLHLPKIKVESNFLNEMFWKNHKDDELAMLRSLFTEDETKHEVKFLRNKALKAKAAKSKSGSNAGVDYAAKWILEDGGPIRMNNDHALERWSAMSKDEQKSLKQLYNVNVGLFTYVWSLFAGSGLGGRTLTRLTQRILSSLPPPPPPPPQTKHNAARPTGQISPKK